jgi:hypothetical protein
MLRWLALAAAGLLVAVAVAYAAGRLASPKVGLTSEPVSAGAKLAPPEARKPSPAHSRKRRRSSPGSGRPTPVPPTTTATTTVTTPAPIPPRTTTARPAPRPAPRRDDSGGGRDD